MVTVSKDKLLLVSASAVFSPKRVSSLQVTGKAVMLDEIINYVQSLQHQVQVAS